MLDKKQLQIAVSELEGKYRKDIDFINQYRSSSNAATGSKFDSNANVENKNITTLAGEIPKGTMIGINRLLMHDKIKEMWGEELADEYIRELLSHEIYKHDETNIAPYCVSITMYPFLFDGLQKIGGLSKAPTNLDSFCGSFINLVFAVASQFAGAVSTPEWLTYMDYFIRKEYGDDYYIRANEIVTSPVCHRQRTIEEVIESKFQQCVYSLNQPAAARNFQSVFWNIAYFDKDYFNGIFDNFVFPDGTVPKWESVSWLQKKFMKWFNRERTKEVLTFPVETLNLLNDGKQYVDKEWFDFGAKMYSEGHSFFTYTSNSVDSLASCCFDGEQEILIKENSSVRLISFKEAVKLFGAGAKIQVMHNGTWVKAKLVELPGRPMYRITTTNNKQITVTDNHLNPTQLGNFRTDELTEDDYLMFSSIPLMGDNNWDVGYSYEQGVLIGLALRCGTTKEEKVRFDFSDEDARVFCPLLQTVAEQMGVPCAWKYDDKNTKAVSPYTTDEHIIKFIKLFAGVGLDKIDLFCLLQNYDFRRGILLGYRNSLVPNDIIVKNKNMFKQVEALATSLGIHVKMVKILNDEGEISYRCKIYSFTNRKKEDDYRIYNNGIFFKIKNIEKLTAIPDKVYCLEMFNRSEPYFTLPLGIITHNCRLRNELQDNTFSYTLGAGGVSTGSKGVMTININRLVQNAVKNKIPIEEAVAKQVENVHKFLLSYNEIIKDYFKSKLLPVYDAGFISLDKQFLTVGINGFVEGAEFLGIAPTVNEEYMNYGEKILKPIFELNRKDKRADAMFNTEFVPAENLGVKNAKWDKADGYFVPRDCYNSYFYIVEDEKTNIVDKLILHGKQFTQYLDGGSALHENLKEHLSFEQYKEVMLDAVKTGCSYFTFNIPNTICNVCGHISKHNIEECPACGSKDVDYITRIIGYLKRVSKFSEARQKEATKRYYE